MVAQGSNEKFGGQGLAGGPRRAHLLAATALGTREDIEAILPGHVCQRADSQRFALERLQVLHCLGGDRLAVSVHGSGSPQRFRTVHLAARVNVYERQESVPSYAHRNGQANHYHPGHGDDDLYGRGNHNRVLQSPNRCVCCQLAQKESEREMPCGYGSSRILRQQGVFQYAKQQHANDDPKDDALDEAGMAPGRPQKAGRLFLPIPTGRFCLSGPSLARASAHHNQPDDTGHRGPRNGLNNPLPGRKRTQNWERVVRVHHLAVAGNQSQKQQRERHHH